MRTMLVALYTWALAVMVALQPPAKTPWADTYEATAHEIVDAAVAEPIFAGDDGVIRTIATDLSLAWFESRFQIDAKGDCDKLGCRAFGLFQTQARTAGVAPDELTASPQAAIAHAHPLISRSLKICAGRPPGERLGWYAGGGDGCGDARARRQSVNRVALAHRIAASAPRDLESLDP